MPEHVIELAPEPQIDGIVESTPVLETVPQSVDEPAESSTESSL